MGKQLFPENIVHSAIDYVKVHGIDLEFKDYVIAKSYKEFQNSISREGLDKLPQMTVSDILKNYKEFLKIYSE